MEECKITWSIRLQGRVDLELGPSHHQNKQQIRLIQSLSKITKHWPFSAVFCRSHLDTRQRKESWPCTALARSAWMSYQKHSSVAASYLGAMVSCRHRERRLGGAAWASGRGCPQRCSLTRKRVPGSPLASPTLHNSCQNQSQGWLMCESQPLLQCGLSQTAAVKRWAPLTFPPTQRLHRQLSWSLLFLF